MAGTAGNRAAPAKSSSAAATFAAPAVRAAAGVGGRAAALHGETERHVPGVPESATEHQTETGASPAVAGQIEHGTEPEEENQAEESNAPIPTDPATPARGHCLCVSVSRKSWSNIYCHPVTGKRYVTLLPRSESRRLESAYGVKSTVPPR